MSEKSRKPEDHTNLLKSSRASTLPQLGAAPGIVPHHSPYNLPPDGSIALHPSHALTYGIMRPSIGLRPAAMSNDLGPPIFMPSLNLGVPKQQQHPVTAISQPPPSQGNVKSKHNNLPQNTAFMQDIMFPSVFHASPMPPGVPTSYITHPQNAPLPSTMKQQVPSHPTSISKPSSVAAATQCQNSKAGTVVRPTPKIQSTTPTTMGIASSNSKGEVPNASGMGYAPPQSHMASPYLPANHPGLISSTPSHSMGTLSKMLMSPSSQQPISTSGRQIKSLGTPDTYGHTSSPGQQGVTVSKSGSQKISSYQNAAVDGYTLSGRGTLMGQMVGSTLATSGQATSTATFTDTKVERPPQPSAVLPQQQTLPPSSTVTSSVAVSQSNQVVTTTPRGEKMLTTAEKASNIIISVPGLTGKHIAAITNNTTTVQQSDDATHSAYTSSPISQPGGGVTNHSSALAKPSSGEYNMVNQPLTSESGWGAHSQQKANMIFHSPLPPGHPNMGGANSSSGQGFLQSNIPPATHISGVAMTTTGSSPHSHPPGPSSVMGSPGSHTLSSPNSSPRPRILRTTKRPIDGSWKMDGQTNTSHNPGSPLFNKLRQDLGAAKSMRSSSSYGGTFNSDSIPLSPTTTDGGDTNHISSVKIEPSDLMASPRKKPRKQNVVANDDQYASNVPDGFHVKSELFSSNNEGGNHWHHLSEELKKPAHIHNSVTTRSHRSRGEGSGMDTKDTTDVFYLSQLRRCPYPINGVYKVHHKAARNHFRRHADIKHREEERISAYEIASTKKSWQRTPGWKLQHFSTQLDEMLRVEDSILKTMERLENSVHNLESTSTCQVDHECVESLRELLKGNIDRSSRTKEHIDATKSELIKVLNNHQPQVRELLTKLVGKEPPHPLEQLSLLHHNQTLK